MRRALESRISSSYGKLPISFEPNVGQAANPAQFLARGRDFTLYLTPDDIVVGLLAHDPLSHSLQSHRDERPIGPAHASLVHLQFLGANLHPEAAAEGPLAGKINYFRGSDPASWHTDVPTFRRVHYHDIYPGIDVVYYGNQEGKLEHDFIVAPGADPHAIAFSIRGAARIAIHRQGLLLQTPSGDLLLHVPSVYQKVDGRRRKISASYQIAQDGVLHFRLANYDRTRPLVIDPVITHVSVFGGSDEDAVEALAIDKYGQTYVTGVTYSTDFPVANAFQSSWNRSSSRDYAAFVTKINPAGTAIVYSTYLGGAGTEANAILVDSSGRAYVAGGTGSDFPLKNAYQPAFGGGGSDGFITILSSTGNSLVYSSYIGGNEGDFVRAIARDSAGNLYLTGSTDGGFPSLHTLNSPGTPGTFVAKTNSAGALQYSVMYGNIEGLPTGIAVDRSGSAYIIGYDNVGTAPITASAAQKTCPNPSCAFVAKISPSGTSLVYSTFLGNNSAAATGIALDSDNNAYVAGATGNGLKVSITAFQKDFNGGGFDGFVSKVNPTGSAVIWSTYLGGSGDDVITSMALDANRTVYLTGYTCSPNFPQRASIQKWIQLSGQSCQLFVSTLNGSLSDIAYYSTYFGGAANNGYDYLAIDPKLNVYLAGFDFGNIHPTKGALSSPANESNMDVFAAKLDIVDDIAFTQKPSATHVYTGDYLTYQLTATSLGPDFGSNILLVDSVPGGTVFVSADAGGGTCKTPVPGQLGALNCTLPRLDKGGSWTVLFKVKVTATLPGSVYNGAGAGSSTQDFNLNNNTSATNVPMN
jgi:uncharacterized repeat protein (TIGR01451 family)